MNHRDLVRAGGALAVGTAASLKGAEMIAALEQELTGTAPPTAESVRIFCNVLMDEATTLKEAAQALLRAFSDVVAAGEAPQ